MSAFADTPPNRPADPELALLRHVSEAMLDAVVVIDRNWVFSFASRRALEIVNRESILGQNIFDLFPGNSEEPFYSTYRTTMEQGTPGSFEAFHSEPLNLWLKVEAKPFPGGIIVFFSDITSRKQAEQREQATAARLAEVLEVTSDAILTLDRDWRYTFLNAAAHRLIDPTRRLLGCNMWEEFPLVEGTPAGDVMRRAMEQQQPGNAETYYPEPLNCWLSVQVQPAPEGIVIFFRDITAQKNHDKILQAQQETLAVVQRAARVVTWDLDLTTERIHYGQGFFSLSGRPREELSQLTAIEELVHDTHTHTLRETIDEAVRTRAIVALEFPLTAMNGHVIWLESRGQAAPASDGSMHLRGISIDVTQRKLDEEELLAEQAESERKRAELETIYATTPVGLALFDAVDFRFLNCNDQEAQMIGTSREELIGSRLDVVVPHEKVPALLGLMRHVAAGNYVKDQLLEGELPARPGEKRAWSVNYSPVFADDGSVRAISSASIEITNQKRAEAALVQSEKLAAVGRLASSISHEINNPLEAITNLLYLVAGDQNLSEDVKLYVHMAQSELSRVSQIATQTLRFHRQAVNATHISPEELVGAVLRLYTGRLANSSIRVDARYSTDTRVLCFENDIRQVLNNLIANAIDAMRSGGRLVIRAHAAHDLRGPVPISGIRLTIADSGHGMSPQVVARIFEPFYTTKDLQGTGLGLWISHGIVERHQGRLTVRSSTHPSSHGTIFSLFLPCEER